MHAQFIMTDHTVEIPNWTVTIPNVPGKEPTILKGAKYHTIGDNWTPKANDNKKMDMTCCNIGCGAAFIIGLFIVISPVFDFKIGTLMKVLAGVFLSLSGLYFISKCIQRCCVKKH